MKKVSKKIIIQKISDDIYNEMIWIPQRLDKVCQQYQLWYFRYKLWLAVG